MNFSEEFKAVNDKIEKLNFEIKAATLATGEYKGIPKEDRNEFVVVLNSQLTKLELEKNWLAVNLEFEKNWLAVNRKIEQATLGTGEYKDIPKEDRERILVKLEADKEWFKKQQEKKRDSSPTVISKETYIQKIQELLPGVKLSDSVCKLIKINKLFYCRLRDCLGWTREDAKNFINEANLFLKTNTRQLVSRTKGYHFADVVSHMGQGVTIVQKAYDIKGKYCAKIGPLRIIQPEYEVSKKVVGPCVMPVLDFIILPEERAVIVSPLYIRTVANWMLNLEEFAEEDDIVPILLCGISAIYSFACQGLAHCDIKLTNIMLETSVKVILIDLGSATDFEGVISSTTPGIRFEHCSPSIRYDINSLSIAIARIMLKKNEDFATKDHLFSMISPLASRYPVVFEMLCLMRIDENFGSAAELLVVWKNIYAVAQEKKAFFCDYPFFAPPN